MALFVDASALVKLYVEERGTEAMLDVAGRSEEWGGLFISDHVGLEVVSTLGAKLRGRTLARDEYLAALRDFDLDYPHAYYVLEVSASHVEQAIMLARQYHDSGVKTMDLLHVVSGLHVSRVEGQQVVMITADRGLGALAVRAGCGVFDPTRDSVSFLEPLRLPLR